MFFFDPNAAAIRPNLWLGGSSNEQNIEDLQSKGVTHILQVGRELVPSHPNKFQYIRISIDDHELEDLIPHFPRCMQFIDDAIKSGGAVLVHCMAGMSRSPSICIAYLAWSEGLSYDDAFKAVKSARSCVSPNMAFVCQLKDYIASGCKLENWGGWNSSNTPKGVTFADRARPNPPKAQAQGQGQDQDQDQDQDQAPLADALLKADPPASASPTGANTVDAGGPSRTPPAGASASVLPWWRRLCAS